ncbi:MAG: hypothetical protein ACI4FX_03215 [Agathobacter sp.]
MKKLIRTLQSSDWLYFDFSDIFLLEMISDFGNQLGKDFQTIELYINDYDDHCSYINIELRNSDPYQKPDSPRRTLQVHRFCSDTCSAEDFLEFKKEAYRIKKLIKRNFTEKHITSSFCWK